MAQRLTIRKEDTVIKPAIRWYEMSSEAATGRPQGPGESKTYPCQERPQRFSVYTRKLKVPQEPVQRTTMSSVVMSWLLDI